MYSEQDYNAINRQLRRAALITGIVACIVLAGYILAMARRVTWLVYLLSALLFVSAAFGILYHVLPVARYRRFLLDMQQGGSHDMVGRIVSVSPDTELQDGVRVHHVHLYLTDEADERIVYLNASKAGGFPPAGTDVRLRCFGRHIIECNADHA